MIRSVEFEWAEGELLHRVVAGQTTIFSRADLVARVLALKVPLSRAVADKLADLTDREVRVIQLYYS